MVLSLRNKITYIHGERVKGECGLTNCIKRVTDGSYICNDCFIFTFTHHNIGPNIYYPNNPYM